MEPTKNIEQFMKDWTGKVDRIIASFGYKEHELEDVRQDIFIRIYSKNYLEGYDETKGAFSTYVYSLVLNMLRRYYGKNKRNPLKQSVSLDTVIRNDEDDGGLYIDMIPGEDGFDKVVQVEFWNVIEEIRAHLATLHNPRGTVEGPDGVVRDRSLLQIFEFILEGKDRQDMAYLLRYSEGSISLMFKQLRNMPQVKKLNGLIKG